jgi:hypothetical protein
MSGSLGDLTGTGNPVLFTYGGSGGAGGYYALYVLGDALDDKIDAYMSFYHPGGFDTIHLDNTSKTSLVMSAPIFESEEAYQAGLRELGSVRILKGTEHIPVRINPLLAVKPMGNSPATASILEVNPNPTDGMTTLMMPSTGRWDIEVMNTLGVVCTRVLFDPVVGHDRLTLDLSQLPRGAYILRAMNMSSSVTASAHLIKY